MEDIRQLCSQAPLHPREIWWYQLNRRRLVDLRNRSAYCKNDKILLINDVLLIEVVVDVSILKLHFPKNWRTRLLQYRGFHSVDDNDSDLLTPYVVWRIWHIPTFHINVVPSTSVVMGGVPQAWNLKTPLYFERSKSVISATQRNTAEDQNPANVSCFVREANNQVPLLKSLLSWR
jgi:hypothetical protein